MKYKNRILTTVILICSIILVILFYHLESDTILPRDNDKEFGTNSRVAIEQLSDSQIDALYKLCKVWGLAKYYHPSVVDGTLNWDAELFRVIPKVLQADNAELVNEVLYDWLFQFPFEVETPDEVAQEWIALQEEAGGISLDISWTEDKELWGEHLSAYLQKLAQTRIADRENAYASFGGVTVDFSNESSMRYETKYHTDDDGIKLLALFRFWNAYEYYSPNIEITKQDWDEVLMEAIPKMIAADTYENYVLALAEVAAKTGDAHNGVHSRGEVIHNYYGKYYLPCQFLTVDGQVVVSAVSDEAKGEGLQVGDIFVEIDNISIKERLETLKKYVVIPEDDKFTFILSYTLLKTENEQAQVKVLRGRKEISLQITASPKAFRAENPYKNGLLSKRIGYVDPSTLKDGDFEKLMEQFANTDGIIIDLRYYPSESIMYLLGEYILQEQKIFAKLGINNHAIPGSYYYMNYYVGKGTLKEQGDEREFPVYEGKVVLLIDERTQSHGEFTTMALRQAPNAVVVGSPSLGADGNSVAIELPGYVYMNISSIGVYTPEGGETQRVGVLPDIECYQTVQGIGEERDELIEKAVELIE